MSRRQSLFTRVNPNDPEAAAECDRCGAWFNRSELVWQEAWAGTHLYRTGALVCKRRCYDIPQEQLRTIILPPDPPPVLNARVPNFAYEEQIPLIAQQGASGKPPPWGAGPQLLLCDQSGEIVLLAQYTQST